MPLRQQAGDVQLRRQLDELAQCPQQHDEQHGVGPDHAQHVLQQHAPHAPLFPVQQRARVTQHHLHAALGPAQALPPQALEGLRHQDEAQRIGFVADVPVRALQAPADVDVLGHHVIRPPAHLVQGGTAEAGDHPGDGEDAPVYALRALDHADDRGKLGHLQAAEQGGPVADARVAGDCTDPVAADQVPDDPVQRMFLQHCIAVDAHQVLRASGQCAHAQRIGLAQVTVQVQYAQPRVLCRQYVQPRAGVIAAAIIDGDHFVVGGVTLGQRRSECVIQVVCFVVAGHQQAREGGSTINGGSLRGREWRSRR